MADLVTHLCSGLLVSGALAPRRAGVLTMGALLPDLGSRMPALALEALVRMGIPVPEVAIHPWAVLHMPLGTMLGCALLAGLFPEQRRVGVFGWMVLGAAIHYGLDLLQDHHGCGYFLAFPATTSRWELGLIGSEQTVVWAPWLALATAVVWSLRWWTSRRKSSDR